MEIVFKNDLSTMVKPLSLSPTSNYSEETNQKTSKVCQMTRNKPNLKPLHSKINGPKYKERVACLWNLYELLIIGNNRMNPELINVIRGLELSYYEVPIPALYFHKLDNFFELFTFNDDKLNSINLNMPRSRILPYLDRLVMPQDYFFEYKVPIPSKNDPSVAVLNPKLIAESETFSLFEDKKEILCNGCNKYIPFNSFYTSQCHHHSGRYIGYMKMWSCCKDKYQKLATISPCTVKIGHVNNGNFYLERFQGFDRVIGKSNANNFIIAIDCEMCYTQFGLELCQVTLVDLDGNILLSTLVQPVRPVVDYNTEYSGIEAKDFENSQNPIETFESVRAKIRNIISPDTYIVGHGLDCDLRILRLFHDRIIDTSYLYPHSDGLPVRHKLKYLTKKYLKVEIQNQSTGHDSTVDARMALKLFKLKILQQEVKVSNKIPLALKRCF